MNERSPGGNYSCPGTPNQTKKSYKSQWDEPERGTKSTILNVPTMNESKYQNLQQHSMEDISKSSLSPSKHKKINGNGPSDPRFKRVISAGVQNDVCIGTDMKASKPSLVYPEKGCLTAKNSVRTIKDYKSNPPCLISKKNIEQSKCYQNNNFELHGYEKLTSPEYNIDQTYEHLKAVDKLSFNHDLVVKSFAKDSTSDCTVHTLNTSLISDEFGNAFLNEMKRVPSGTRIKKVQNWISDQAPRMEKKLSVITVIGQMQGPDSSALREIDKRRKLVKELDRYAVCKKITESEKENETFDLATTNKSSATEEKVLLPESKETQKNVPVTKDCEQKLTKECASNNGKFRFLFSSVNYQKLFCFLVLISATLCWCAFSFTNLNMFNSKPKPVTWYEKICEWIWEFFRPADLNRNNSNEPKRTKRVQLISNFLSPLLRSPKNFLKLWK